MGSELLVAVIEIEKGREPHWPAAEALLAAMSDEEVRAAYLRAMDLDEAHLVERGIELPAMRAEIEAALEALRDAWDGAGGDIVRYPGARTEMLIGGGTSWGEDVEACTQINLFCEAGLARTVGFAIAADEAASTD